MIIQSISERLVVLHCHCLVKMVNTTSLSEKDYLVNYNYYGGNLRTKSKFVPTSTLGYEGIVVWN